MGETLERIAVFASDQQLAAVLSGSPYANRLSIDLCQNTDELVRLVESPHHDLALLIPPLSHEILHYLKDHKSEIPFPLVALFPEPLEETEPVLKIADQLVLIPDNADALCRAFGGIVQRWQDEYETEFHSGMQMLQECCQRDTDHPDQLINRLTATLGSLLHASSVLYNRISNETLVTVSSWNLPTPVNRESAARGHICFDVLTRSNTRTLEIHDLQHTRYADSDPTVSEHQLATYVGHTVWCGGKPVGVLCAVDKQDRTFSRTGRMLLEVAALMVGIQEERQRNLHPDDPTQDRYRLMFEHAPAGLYRCTTDGTILEANRKLVQMLGYPDRETLLSRNMRDIARDPEDRDNWVANIKRKETEQQSTYVARRFDGSIIWVEDTGHAVLDKTGNVRYFEGSMTDITRRVELEETLRQSQKMDAVGRLAGGFAHEFNNLLTVINGYSELIQSSLPADDPNRERIHSVMQAGNRAAELVDMLLAFSRKQMIHPARLSIRSILDETCEILGRLAGATVQIDLECPGDLPDIKADREQFQQLMINLGLNAVAAVRDSGTANEGHIQLTCGQTILTDTMETVGAQIGPGPFLQIAVQDNGIGIPQDMLDLIFEPFFTTREIGKGAGLGLAAVHGIVNQNGAGITVQSAPGKGSTFTVYWSIPDSLDG